VFCCDELDICCDELEICCDELDLIRDNGWSLPMQVTLLTLTHGPVSLATMVSEPASRLLAVGSGQAGNGYLFYIDC
jgi:hypothetical protein